MNSQLHLGINWSSLAKFKPILLMSWSKWNQHSLLQNLWSGDITREWRWPSMDTLIMIK